MGLDIGSVTTKGVVITEDGDIAARASELTKSDPVSASSRVLDRLGHELQNRGVNSLPAGFYTTGSGRRLIQEIFRADEAVDEITAHARSATFYHPEADTVFEIGGQDSKFIRIENGRVNSFIMNRLCAAGTGSFLEEQAVRLNVDIETQFSDYAFRSAAPSRLGTRCTVFMDSDLVHHIQKGESTEDLCAGLAYSIVENYLHNVSANPGEHIIFQGGVAINRAVHAAFEAKLGRPINLHPAPIYAGAVGAALVARDSAPDGKTRFPGFSSERESYTTEYRTCTGCANRCDIMTVTSAGGKRLSFGSICGKHGASPVRSRTTIPGYGKAPMDRYQELLYADYLTEVSGDNRKTGKDRGTVALPSGLTLYQDYPFWAAFFTSLGFTPVSTGDGDESTAAEGKEKLPVETCMPMRMLFGHALQADRLKTDYIFVPHTPGVKQHEEEAPRYLCPYTQTAGYLIRKAVTADTIILDRPVQGERTSWLYRASRTLAISRNDIVDALSRAEYAEELFLKKCREEGKQILESLGTAEMQGLVLIGRPYVIHDMYLNNQAALRIEETGMVPMPAEFLDTRGEDIGVFWDRVHWSMGRQMLKAASFTRKHPQLHPLLMTSFGCGPDGFLIPFLEEMLKGSPRLVLEFDENRIDTGMITRIEAYIRSLGNYSRGHNSRRRHTVWRPSAPLADYECFIPRFSDHAYAYAGALRAAGCSTEVLPPTDNRSIDLARKQVNGNECHPFLTILGDLLRLAETRDGRASREAIYYAPSYVGSCLINAYETSMQITLDNQGIEDLHLLDFGNMQLMKELGLIYPYYLAMASYAIDRLTKWAHEIVPYENQRGSVLATHRHNMERLLVRMSERKIMQGIREAVERMKNVAVGSPPGTTGTEAHRGRTALGVVGDVFTRINPAANFSLFDKIRDSGFDVYASALIMDVVLYRYEQLYRRLSDDGKKIAGGAAKALLPAISILKRRVDRLFPDTIRTPQESSFPEVNGRTARFIDYRVDNLISLNINRIYELSDAGARGILNVMCPNCMIGTMSEAFFPDIKVDLPHLPVVSLSFGDQQETHVDNRLEAFLHLVRENNTHQRDDCLE